MKIYTVLDKDAKELDNHVFTAPNDTVAMRIIKIMITIKTNGFHKGE